MNLYPLRFEPIFRQYIWGGRRLGTFLNKPIGDDDDYAESWELVDHANDQSVVANGPLQGKTLSELVKQFAADLLGSKCMAQISSADRPQQLHNRFPLLMKYLDANRVLSVQVHPDDDYATTMETPDLGKTEAWYVIHAEPNSKIFAGLKPGVTKRELRDAVASGETESCLHVITPNAGDCIFIPAGTIHAIGAGLVIAEIQQASDTTFRLFDWNRVDKNGLARPLHIDQSFDVIDFDRGPVDPQVPCPVESQFAEIENLVTCDKFVMNRWKIDRPITIGGDKQFRVITTVNGAIAVQDDPSGEELALGQTMLLPAVCSAQTLTPNGSAEFLEIRGA